MANRDLKLPVAHFGNRNLARSQRAATQERVAETRAVSHCTNSRGGANIDRNGENKQIEELNPSLAEPMWMQLDVDLLALRQHGFQMRWNIDLLAAILTKASGLVDFRIPVTGPRSISFAGTL